MPRLEFDPLEPRTKPAKRWIAAVRTDSWRAIVPKIDHSRCTGCRLCWKYCPEASVAMKAELPEIDYAHCKGCGICATECPVDCITLEPEPAA